MTSFSPKVALVTGAGRGLGRGIALELARKGLKVALVARSQPQIDQVASEIDALGGTCLGIGFDLTNLSAIEDMVSQIQAELGEVDILVNNAAVIAPLGLPWEVDQTQWVKLIETNLIAPYKLIRAVLPGMLKRNWGRIINVSSGAAVHVIPRSAAYSSSKAGLNMLSFQLAAELVDTGIAVVVLDPGGLDTAMQAEIRQQPLESLGTELLERFQGYYERGELFSPVEAGKRVAALAGDAGEKFRGQFIHIWNPEIQAYLQESN